MPARSRRVRLEVARKEVINVPAEMLTKNGRSASRPVPTTPVADDELREWARKHLERVRRLKFHVTAFVLGMIVLTPIWALVEWQSNGGFERWSEQQPRRLGAVDPLRRRRLGSLRCHHCTEDVLRPAHDGGGDRPRGQATDVARLAEPELDGERPQGVPRPHSRSAVNRRLDQANSRSADRSAARRCSRRDPEVHDACANRR